MNQNASEITKEIVIAAINSGLVPSGHTADDNGKRIADLYANVYKQVVESGE